jgi:hypothetical protein
LENYGQEGKNRYREISFVKRTIKNWNQLPAEVLVIFPCKAKIFGESVKKGILNGVK